MLQCVSEASAKATGLSEDLLSCKLIEGKNQFLMLKRREESHVILVIDHNNGERGPQEFQDTSSCFGIKLLTSDP